MCVYIYIYIYIYVNIYMYACMYLSLYLSLSLHIYSAELRFVNWGFDYNFTHYDKTQTRFPFKHILYVEHIVGNPLFKHNQGLFETIVGEVVAESPYY